MPPETALKGVVPRRSTLLKFLRAPNSLTLAPNPLTLLSQRAVLVGGSHGGFGFADDSANYFGSDGGGPKNLFTRIIYRKIPPPPVLHLCASNEANNSRWVYEGKKKKETEKGMKPITYSVLVLGLDALLFYRVSDPPSVGCVAWVAVKKWAFPRWAFSSLPATTLRVHAAFS